MFSHTGSIDHAFDWGGAVAGDNLVFIVAPVDSYIVFANDSLSDEDPSSLGGSGFGNTVTLRAAESLPGGEPVFLSFSHLMEGSVPHSAPALTTNEMYTDQSTFVEAGTIIGIMGATGAGPNHLHMQVGTSVTSLNRSGFSGG